MVLEWLRRQGQHKYELHKEIYIYLKNKFALKKNLFENFSCSLHSIVHGECIPDIPKLKESEFIPEITNYNFCFIFNHGMSVIK